MKTMFKDLQKSHMKQFKSEMKGDGTDSRPVKKRFVQDCLVRVELQEKWEESHRDILKVYYYVNRCAITRFAEQL